MSIINRKLKSQISFTSFKIKSNLFKNVNRNTYVYFYILIVSYYLDTSENIEIVKFWKY